MRKFILPLLLGTTLSLASLSASAEVRTTQDFWVRVAKKSQNIIVATDGTNGGTEIKKGTTQADLIQAINDVAATSTKTNPTFNIPAEIGTFTVDGKALQSIDVAGTSLVDDGLGVAPINPPKAKGPGVVSRAVTGIKNYMNTHDPLMVAAPTFALLNWYNQNQTIAFENDPNAPYFANVAAYGHHELTKGSLVPYAQVPHIFAGLIDSPLTKGTSTTAIAVPAAFDSVRLLSHAYQLLNDPTYAPYLYATTELSDVVDGAYSPLVLASLLSSKVAPLALAIPVGKMAGELAGKAYDVVPAAYEVESYVSRGTVTSVANPLAALTTIIAGYKAGAEFSGVRRAMLAYGLYQGAQTLQTLSDYPAVEAGVLTATVTWGGPLGWAAALGYGGARALNSEMTKEWVVKPVGNAISSVRSYIAGPQQQENPTAA